VKNWSVMSSPSEIEIEEDTRLCRVYNARVSYLRGDPSLYSA